MKCTKYFFTAGTILFSMIIVTSAHGQLSDPKEKDKKFLRVFAFYDGSKQQILWATSGKFVSLRNITTGSKPSENDSDKPKWYQSLTLQWDYGLLGKKGITPTGKRFKEEADLAKNAGALFYSYATYFPHSTNNRFHIDIGLEHKRYRAKTLQNGEIVDSTEESDLVTPLAGLGLRFAGQPLGLTDSAFNYSYQFLLNSTFATAVTPDLDNLGSPGKKVHQVFFEPLGTLNLYYLLSPAPNNDPAWYRWRLRIQGGLMYASASNLGRWQIDTGLTYYLSPNNGIELRYFRGFFDHNIVDEKDVLSLNFVHRF